MGTRDAGKWESAARAIIRNLPTAQQACCRCTTATTACNQTHHAEGRSSRCRRTRTLTCAQHQELQPDSPARQPPTKHMGPRALICKPHTTPACTVTVKGRRTRTHRVDAQSTCRTALSKNWYRRRQPIRAETSRHNIGALTGARSS